MEHIKSIPNDALKSFTETSLSTGLVLSVMAVGCHVLECEALEVADIPLSAVQLFEEARRLIEPFILGHHSLLKIQVLSMI